MNEYVVRTYLIALIEIQNTLNLIAGRVSSLSLVQRIPLLFTTRRFPQQILLRRWPIRDHQSGHFGVELKVGFVVVFILQRTYSLHKFSQIWSLSIPQNRLPHLRRSVLSPRWPLRIWLFEAAGPCAWGRTWPSQGCPEIIDTV